jgi:hypothetical protein
MTSTIMLLEDSQQGPIGLITARVLSILYIFLSRGDRLWANAKGDTSCPLLWKIALRKDLVNYKSNSLDESCLVELKAPHPTKTHVLME